jgi:hypothetical protein
MAAYCVKPSPADVLGCCRADCKPRADHGEEEGDYSLALSSMPQLAPLMPLETRHDSAAYGFASRVTDLLSTETSTLKPTWLPEPC